MVGILIAAVIGIAAVYGLVKLLLRNRRHAKLLTDLASQKGWTVEADFGRSLPDAILGQTVLGLGDPANDFTFDLYRKITGKHRGREFILISRRQKPFKRTELSDETYILTPLDSDATHPVPAIRPASKVLDAWGAVDGAVAKANDVTTPARYPLSPEFDMKHAAFGFDGVADFMTRDRQDALLANPGIIRREDELWYQRFFVLPVLSEKFAWISFSSVDPHTILNRLDSLMDWAEIAGNTSETRN